jgi:stearoyl-CoA desaturase (delta-9 desaturase)
MQNVAAVEPMSRARGYDWVGALPFIVVHILAVVGPIFTPIRTIDVVVGIALYWIRMFFVTGAYHRYFSHRTYKTSRWFQFVLALGAMSSSQKGVLWWAAHHRTHHKFSDTEKDVHSPIRKGLMYAQCGWLFDGTDKTDYSKVKDLAKYPELVFLNRYWYIPPALLGFGIWLALGWSGLWIAFMASTVVLWHGTFTINSLTHVWGRKVYPAGDESRNSAILAFITMGEGWHNNHHYYQASTRQGFHWWQFDFTYYILKVFSWLGLVWDLREPPAEVVAGTWRAKKSPAQLAAEPEAETAEAA